MPSYAGYVATQVIGWAIVASVEKVLTEADITDFFEENFGDCCNCEYIFYNAQAEKEYQDALSILSR